MQGPLVRMIACLMGWLNRSLGRLMRQVLRGLLCVVSMVIVGRLVCLVWFIRRYSVVRAFGKLIAMMVLNLVTLMFNLSVPA